jgi:hypothetical protein
MAAAVRVDIENFPHKN